MDNLVHYARSVKYEIDLPTVRTACGVYVDRDQVTWRMSEITCPECRASH